MSRFEFELSDVSVAYVSARSPVLNGVSLSIERGSWVCMVGENGSGKSTLGKVLTGLTNISKGQVATHETTTQTASSNSTSSRTTDHRVQIVFQNPDAQIVGTTVYEDLCFGMENLGVPTEMMPERVRRALHSVGLSSLHFDTPVDSLSGGQKQLLCIAGCLVMNPSAIIFDEPTSMLSPDARQSVLETVQTLHKTGMTIVWITQWMDEVPFADRVIAINQGEVVFDHTPEQFFYPNTLGDHKCTDYAPSPCRALGFLPPYVVQVAEEIVRNGVALPGKPVREDHLVRLVGDLCQSK